ncbi:MAG: hypothetical protein KGZ96_07835 [Clostridia bacterium]|jgi:hypothetical protein|nr:hypothetical protein [Clostridia bacterium]
MLPFLSFGDINWSLLAKLIVPAVLLSLTVNYLIKYPMLPKMTAYQGVKTAMKLNLEYRAGDWQRAEEGDITVYFLEEDRDAAAIVLAVSEAAIREVNQILNHQLTGKIPVMVYPDRLALNKSFGWESDVSAMGAYWAGVVKVLSPFAWIEGEDQQLIAEEFKYSGPVVHEYVHLVVDEKTRGNYTRWFTEALAQYWEREITGFQFDSPEGDLHQELYPLIKMDRQFDNLPNQALAYSQSLAIADFLYQEYSHLQVEQLLVELGKGLSMSQALFNSIGLDLNGFEQQFHRWLRAIYPAEHLGNLDTKDVNTQASKAHWTRQVS